MNLIAIDPGASGGIACRVGLSVTAIKMPDDEAGIVQAIDAIIDGWGNDQWRVIMEKVSGYAGENQPGSAMFNFGDGYGFLRGLFMGKQIRLDLVRPQEWQSKLGIGNRRSCATRAEWKHKLREVAQRKFPHLKVTLSTADALLILDHTLSSQITQAPGEKPPF